MLWAHVQGLMQLEIRTINVISGIVYFRKIMFENSKQEWNNPLICDFNQRRKWDID